MSGREYNLIFSQFDTELIPQSLFPHHVQREEEPIQNRVSNINRPSISRLRSLLADFNRRDSFLNSIRPEVRISYDRSPTAEERREYQMEDFDFNPFHSGNEED